MSAQLANMVAATGAGAADLLYLVQNNSDKQLSIANLFANVSVPVGIGSFLMLAGTPEVIASGPISITTPLSNLALSGNVTLTIASGTQGQIKIITAISGSSASAVINANIANNSITFKNKGDSAILLYNNGSWFFLGGTATVS